MADRASNAAAKVTDFKALLGRLAECEVKFILVGGAAATAHGSARLTLDLDIVYERTPENLARIVAAFNSQKPYLRGAPAGLPFQWEERTLAAGLNLAARRISSSRMPISRSVVR